MAQICRASRGMDVVSFRRRRYPPSAKKCVIGDEGTLAVQVDDA